MTVGTDRGLEISSEFLYIHSDIGYLPDKNPKKIYDILPIILCIPVVAIHAIDLYYYYVLPEPWRSYGYMKVTMSIWLLVNGIVGILTAIYLYVYYLSKTNESFRFKSLFKVILYGAMIFRIIWTIVGWICFHYILAANDISGFMTYMWMKLFFQSFFYPITSCVLFN